MAFADRLNLTGSDDDGGFASRVKELSGCDWPPATSADATVIFTRAGWTQDRVEQAVNMFFGTYEESNVGELPRGYFTTLTDGTGNVPTFSNAVISGLEKWKASQPQGEMVGPLSPAQWAKRFKVSPTTFRRMKERKSFRWDGETTKLIRIHSADVERLEKR